MERLELTEANIVPQQALRTVFDCLQCRAENSVHVTLDKRAGTGRLKCSACHIVFGTQIHALSEKIDVYYDWVDTEPNRHGT